MTTVWPLSFVIIIIIIIIIIFSRKFNKKRCLVRMTSFQADYSSFLSFAGE